MGERPGHWTRTWDVMSGEAVQLGGEWGRATKQGLSDYTELAGIL